MADPHEHNILYLLPPRVKCGRCFGTAGVVSKGVFSDPAHLAKHLKKCHAGDTLSYSCSVCNFKGVGRYPLKSVKAHFEQSHAPPAHNAPGTSTRGTLGVQNSGAQSGASVAPRAATRLAETINTSNRRIIICNTVSPTRAAPLSALIVASMDAHNRTLNLSDCNNNFEKTPSPVQLPIRAERRRETSPEDHVGGDTGHSAESEVGAGHSSAPLYSRGVMPRGRCAPSSVVPPRVAREEGDRQRHGRQRVEAVGDRPSRDHPAPATVARQRRRERVAARDMLVAQAEAVASIADLEAFATSVATFFREDASAPGAAGSTRDRSVRSREAGARRMVGGGERSEREGADMPGSATAGPGPSQRDSGDWVREAKRIQALYRANRRKAVR
ncbi:hypothetical protein ALC62_14352 [Cyphomyrmex costatus]|uniref:Uncharacterized protein n=1 Tax=Cyphomyrmex costatus TaxID=456900 RepID=A0A151I8S9_9HYME|nr:hypothetical protein ALC62_14352 [Cyphomyrmex costatus]